MIIFLFYLFVETFFLAHFSPSKFTITSRLICWSRRLADCCSSPSSMTRTSRVELPVMLRSRWMAPYPTCPQKARALCCPSPSHPTLTSATWHRHIATSRKRRTKAVTNASCSVSSKRLFGWHWLYLSWCLLCFLTFLHVTLKAQLQHWQVAVL